MFRFRLLTLSIALVLGLITVALTPAWANPEEPYHFLRAATTFRPDPEDQQHLLDEIERSLVVAHSSVGLLGRLRNDHLAQAGIVSDADWQALRERLEAEPGYSSLSVDVLGQPQTSELPLYYWFQAPLQRVLVHAPLDVRLRAARLGSLFLGMLTLVVVFALVDALVPEQPALRLGLPLILAVHPQFAATMTQVNSTAIAVLAVSVALWVAVRVLHDGLTVKVGALIVGAAALCLLGKTTAWVGMVALGAAVVYRGGRLIRGVAAAGLAVGMLVGIVSLRAEGVLGWYPVDGAQVLRGEDAPQGRRVIEIESGVGAWQTVPPPVVERIRGQRVLIRAWIRSEHGTEWTLGPVLWAASPDGRIEPLQHDPLVFNVGPEWINYAAITDVPADAQCLTLWLLAEPTQVIQFDGVSMVLVDPDTTVQDPVIARSAELLGNTSFETPWILTDIDALLGNRAIAGRSLQVNDRLMLMTDQHTNAYFHLLDSRYSFSTFWGYFGWGIPALPRGLIGLLAGLTLVTGVGLGWHVLRPTTQIPVVYRRMVMACLLAIGVGFMITLLSLEAPVLQFECTRYQGRIVPTAYYVAPLIVPVMLVWVAGLQSWLPGDRARRVAVAALGGLLFAAHIWRLLEQVMTFLWLYGVTG